MERSWTARLKAVAPRVDSLLSGLEEAQLHANATPTAWSLGQCLEHLTLAAEKIAEQLEAALAGHTSELGSLEAWKPGFFERKFIAMCGPDAGGKTPVPKIFEPSGTWNIETTRTRLKDAHARLLAADVKASDTDLVKVKAASAAMPLLKLRMAAWLEACAVHADYHLSQADSLRKKL
ncbi:MAG: DinB family protein [Armatimonas sp.]